METSRNIYRRTDPITSELGAHEVTATGRRASIKQKCLDALKANPAGLTFSELAEKTGLYESQVWKRLSDLKNDGLAKQIDVMRKAANGRVSRWQGVWVAVLETETTTTEQGKLFETPRGYHQ